MYVMTENGSKPSIDTNVYCQVTAVAHTKGSNFVKKWINTYCERILPLSASGWIRHEVGLWDTTAVLVHTALVSYVLCPF